MGIIDRLKGLSTGGLDRRFGTGAWRHNHDRFIRAVDRYYSTAVAIHKERGDLPDAADSEAVAALIGGTERLNGLIPAMDEATEWLHAHHPIEGQVVPAVARSEVGDVPELLTRAASKVAEAVLAASMVRAELRAHRPLTAGARACTHYIDDATELLDRIRAAIPDLAGAAPTGTGNPGDTSAGET